MEKPVDLRIQKTRMALTKAFLKLLGEKRYESITVNELCDEAWVRRATFYKHFGDKDEFFSYMVREMIDKHIQTVGQENQSPRDFWLRMAECVLVLLTENWSLIQAQKSSCMHTTMMALIGEEINWVVLSYLQQAEKAGVQLPVHPAGLLASIITGALQSMCLWWIKQKEPLPREKLVQEMNDLMLKLDVK